jgi:hypothetical protein
VLLDHANAIDFLECLNQERSGTSDCIFHLAVTVGNRSRKLAIVDPLWTPELAHLIALIQRVMCDRQLLSLDTLNDVEATALAAAWLDL